MSNIYLLRLTISNYISIMANILDLKIIKISTITGTESTSEDLEELLN